MKKIFLASIIFLSSSFLYAGFLSNIGGNIINNASNTINSRVHNMISSSLNTNYLNNILGDVSNMSKTFGTSALSALVDHNSFTAGTMEMCYKYVPSKKINFSICSLFNNEHENLNPCSALPNTIGNWHKRDTNGIAFTLGLRDFCNKLAGKTKNIPLKTIVTQYQGFSGQKKADTQGSIFLNDKSNYVKKKDVALDKVVSKFNSIISPNDTKGERNIKALAESQQEGVAFEMLSHIAKNSKGDFTKAQTKAMNNPTIIFKNYSQYSSDVNSVANKNLAQEDNLLDFNSVLNMANIYFSKINQQAKKTMAMMNWKNALAYQNTIFAKKMQWINSAVTKRLQALNLLAYKKAKNEIIYTLPHKLGYYHFLFNKDVIRPKGNNLNLNNAAQTEIINSQTRRQEYYAAKIKVKWARWAKIKSIQLKNMLVKAAIASKFFPYKQVLEFVNKTIVQQP